MKKFRVLGANDEQTVCDCCGRTNLKKTVILEVLDADGNGTGQIERYGVDCAAKATGWTQSDVRKSVTRAHKEAKRAADRARAAELKRQYRAKREAYMAEQAAKVRARREATGW